MIKALVFSVSEFVHAHLCHPVLVGATLNVPPCDHCKIAILFVDENLTDVVLNALRYFWCPMFDLLWHRVNRAHNSDRVPQLGKFRVFSKERDDVLFDQSNINWKVRLKMLHERRQIISSRRLKCWPVTIRGSSKKK